MLDKLRRLASRVLHPKPIIGKVNHTCPMVRLGSDYGGWSINPELISRDSVVYSFGIGEDISFDLALIDRFGVMVHGFDPTPRSIEWVKKQGPGGNGVPAGFVLHEFGIADRDGVISFFAPDNPAHVSHTVVAGATRGREISVPVRRLTTIMRVLGHDRIDLLKMDIEGAEYAVVDDLLKERVPIRQLLIEFHHRFPQVGNGATERALESLDAAGYKLFCISGSAEEYSFIR